MGSTHSTLVGSQGFRCWEVHVLYKERVLLQWYPLHPAHPSSSSSSSGRYCSGEPMLIPATPLGVMEMLKRCRVPTFGKNICVVNRTKHIGRRG